MHGGLVLFWCKYNVDLVEKSFVQKTNVRKTFLCLKPKLSDWLDAKGLSVYIVICFLQ